MDDRVFPVGWNCDHPDHNEGRKLVFAAGGESNFAKQSILSVEVTGTVEETTVAAADVCDRIKILEDWLTKLKELVCEKPEGTTYTYNDIATYLVMWITDPGLVLKSDPQTNPAPIHRPGKCGGY